MLVNALSLSLPFPLSPFLLPSSTSTFISLPKPPSPQPPPPPVCASNPTLHSLVGPPSLHLVTNAAQWDDAARTLRDAGLVSLFVDAAFDPMSTASKKTTTPEERPENKLGAVAFFCRRDEHAEIGNLYYFIPAVLKQQQLRPHIDLNHDNDDDEAASFLHRILDDLQALLHPRQGKRILIYSDSIFEFEELAFLRERLKERWLLDVCRTTSGGMDDGMMTTTAGVGVASNHDMPPLWMDELCRLVTDDAMCERGKLCTWTTPVDICLRHLGMRCMLLMEYVIRYVDLNSEETQRNRQRMVQAWERKFAI